jgi:hypothetical protein
MPALPSIVLGLSAFGVAAAVLHAVAIRPWYLRWGATDAEVDRAMPGDDLVRASHHLHHRPVTNAVTVNARATDIWPWLVQMGHGRGGLYSYDWVDRIMGVLDEKSTWDVLPEYQQLEVGEAIPMGNGPGWPVAAVEPNRSLVLDVPAPGTQVIWSYGLYDIHEARTRLILRITYCTSMNRFLAQLLVQIIDPGSFLMTRKQLLGIKRRAEALARERTAKPQ